MKRVSNKRKLNDTLPSQSNTTKNGRRTQAIQRNGVATNNISSTSVSSSTRGTRSTTLLTSNPGGLRSNAAPLTVNTNNNHNHHNLTSRQRNRNNSQRASDNNRSENKLPYNQENIHAQQQQRQRQRQRQRHRRRGRKQNNNQNSQASNQNPIPSALGNQTTQVGNNSTLVGHGRQSSGGAVSYSDALTGGVNGNINSTAPAPALPVSQASEGDLQKNSTFIDKQRSQQYSQLPPSNGSQVNPNNHYTAAQMQLRKQLIDPQPSKFWHEKQNSNSKANLDSTQSGNSISSTSTVSVNEGTSMKECTMDELSNRDPRKKPMTKGQQQKCLQQGQMKKIHMKNIKQDIFKMPARMWVLPGVNYQTHQDALPHQLMPSVAQTMRLKEASSGILPSYLTSSGWQPDLNGKMRAILFDWMMEVSQEYMLTRQTLHYSLAYVDCFLSRRRCVPKEKLQLIGVTALFVASKVEEIYPPRARDFALTTDGAFSTDEIMKMEMTLLHVLDWQLAPVTPIAWSNYLFHQLALEWENQNSPLSNQEEDEDGTTGSTTSAMKSLTIKEDPKVKQQAKRLKLDDNFCRREEPVSPTSVIYFGDGTHSTVPIEIFESSMDLIDLLILDEKSLLFKPSLLTTAAIFAHLPPQASPRLKSKLVSYSGYSINDIMSVVKWMHTVPRPKAKPHTRISTFSEELPKKDHHQMQKHSSEMLKLHTKRISQGGGGLAVAVTFDTTKPSTKTCTNLQPVPLA
eukprot:g741.t1